ncbi:hypothetical protein [Streptomyces sp. NBC_01443]|uniref:hypothetical protein n=1 Tax=Streptomyces sp. NBC_01443 TaxID=2903868 RepID=UPI0022567839|nr:hypothetical protein [Streptomyces sp. NBC_01443]MCX4629107.1 hypothetical protein [Streptomyces sp. NBC_01443]
MTEQNTADTAPAAEPAPEEQPAGADTLVPVAEPTAPAEAAVPAVPKDRRKLFAALRWTAAVVVFAAVGTGVAYGISRAERTDLPGLSTQDDGRWAYPVLAKPALPAGAPLPAGKDNKDETHYAPLTGLLLPAPEGAEPDAGLKADKGQLVSTDAFLEEYAPDGRAKLKEGLEFEGLRQIVARGWTTADGTRTHVYLLRFHSSGFVNAFRGCDINTQLAGAPALEMDTAWSKVKSTQPSMDGQPVSHTLKSGGTSLYQEPKPANGDEQTKLGCLQAGDVQAVIVQTRKGEVATVPFHQTVVLQSQLLG